MDKLLIITEECPQVPELEYIMKFLKIQNEIYTPRPIIDSGIWSGKFDFTKAPAELALFTGSGSCVDYIVIKNGKPILFVESTKGDRDGNAYYQRLTKFLAAWREYPGVPAVLFYTKQTNINSNSFRMSMRMCKTIGVSAVVGLGVDLNDFEAFSNFEEFQKETNAITSSSGVSVRVHKTGPNHYTIQSRLSKKNTKTISSDPQVGRVTAMCGTICAMDPHATFNLVNHDVENIGKCESKFWYSNGAWDLRLDGFTESTLGKKNMKPYYTLGSNSEKNATILFQLLSENSDFTCVFANHAGSELENLKTPSGSHVRLTGINRFPDLIMVNHILKFIVMFEGKVAANVSEGDHQIDTTAPKFFEFMKKNGYEGYKYSKGLIVYGKTSVKTNNKIWFQVLENGLIKI
jgi:hypothetical protein